MYKSAYQEITHAIETIKDGYKNQRSRKPSYRSTNRQWDCIICTMCTGCGKPLGRYENQNRLAFCFECRKILFPDTINPKESWRKQKTQGWA